MRCLWGKGGGGVPQFWGLFDSYNHMEICVLLGHHIKSFLIGVVHT